MCILDRPRHGRLIEEVRDAGAAIHLIGDGDIAGVFKTTDPESSGVDMYMGVGGAPEGVLGAATIKCRGGQMQGRLILDTEDDSVRLFALADDPSEQRDVAGEEPELVGSPAYSWQTVLSGLGAPSELPDWKPEAVFGIASGDDRRVKFLLLRNT